MWEGEQGGTERNTDCSQVRVNSTHSSSATGAHRATFMGFIKEWNLFLLGVLDNIGRQRVPFSNPVVPNQS